MSKSNLHALSQPEMTSNDPLHELIRQGARDLIARAVETELEGLLSQYADIKTADGRQAVVRNGYLPKRTIQTGVGDVEVQVPKVRDRSGAGIRFNSHLLPPYLKRARSMDELIPWLYLRVSRRATSRRPQRSGRRTGQGPIGQHGVPAQGAMA